MREIINRLTKECFNNERPFVIGTGGFSAMFDGDQIFDRIITDLVLKGNVLSLAFNHKAKPEVQESL